MPCFFVLPLTLLMVTPSISRALPSHKKLTDHDIRSNFNDVQTGMGVLLRELLSVMDDNEKLSEHVHNTNKRFSVLREHNRNTSHVIKGLKKMLKATKKSIHHVEHRLLKNLTKSQKTMKDQLTKFVTNKYAFLAWMVYKLESQNKEQEQLIGDLKTQNSAQQMKTRRLENRLKSLQRRMERCEENVSRNRMLMEQRSNEVGNLRNSVSMILERLGKKKKTVGVSNTRAPDVFESKDAELNHEEDNIDDSTSEVDKVTNETTYYRGNFNTKTSEPASPFSPSGEDDDVVHTEMPTADLEPSPAPTRETGPGANDQAGTHHTKASEEFGHIGNITDEPGDQTEQIGRTENHQKEHTNQNRQSNNSSENEQKPQAQNSNGSESIQNNARKNEQLTSGQIDPISLEESEQSSRKKNEPARHGQEEEIEHGENEHRDRGKTYQVNHGQNRRGQDKEVERIQNEPHNHGKTVQLNHGQRRLFNQDENSQANLGENKQLDHNQGKPPRNHGGGLTNTGIDNSKMKTRTRSV